MLDEKNVDEITIKDICQKADINRSTFYAHYEDIPALLEAMESTYYEQIKQRFSQSSPANKYTFSDSEITSAIFAKASLAFFAP